MGTKEKKETTATDGTKRRRITSKTSMSQQPAIRTVAKVPEDIAQPQLAEQPINTGLAKHSGGPCDTYMAHGQMEAEVTARTTSCAPPQQLEVTAGISICSDEVNRKPDIGTTVKVPEEIAQPQLAEQPSNTDLTKHSDGLCDNYVAHKQMEAEVTAGTSSSSVLLQSELPSAYASHVALSDLDKPSSHSESIQLVATMQSKLQEHQTNKKVIMVKDYDVGTNGNGHMFTAVPGQEHQTNKKVIMVKDYDVGTNGNGHHMFSAVPGQDNDSNKNHHEIGTTIITWAHFEKQCQPATFHSATCASLKTIAM